MSDYQRAAEAIRDADTVIASTGAGISTESGIPDFRSPDGIWSKYPVEEFATIQAFMSNPKKIWDFWRMLAKDLGDSEPNPGHKALAQMEASGKLAAVITQNVDNLHQSAGSETVIEYHGNNQRLRCLQCSHTAGMDLAHSLPGVPHCYCGGIYKPDVILFGESIPAKAMLQAEALARTADVVIIVGTSAQVFPAAQLPFTARERGAFIIECNIEETDFTRTITDVFLEGKAGTTLPKLLDALSAVSA